MRRHAAILLTIVAVGALGGCSGSDPGKHYEDIDALRDAYVQAGGECVHWDQTDKVGGALASGECGTNTVLSLYRSPDEVEDRLEETRNSVFGELPNEWLVGENWIINAEGLIQIQESMGGRIVKFGED